MNELELAVDRAALLLVELQNDIVHESKVGAKGVGGVLAGQVARRGVLGKAAQLCSAARRAQVPVGYINYARKADFPRPQTRLHRFAGSVPTLIEGTWGAETHPAVAPQPQDFIFTRCVGVDGSYGTQLYPVMRQLRRDTLIICGVSTSLAVEGLVRGSVNRGFSCIVVEDCCAAYPDAWHEFAIANTLPLLATVTSSTAVLAALGGAI